MPPNSARPRRDDDLYAAVSEGRRAIGLEHWLPLLYDKLDTLFDYVAGAPFVLDARAEDAADERIAQIADYYAARRAAYAEAPGKSDYKPLPPARLYLSEDEWKERLAGAAAGAPHALRSAAGRSRRRRLRRPGRDAISPPSGRTRTPMSSTPRSPMSARCASGA